MRHVFVLVASTGLASSAIASELVSSEPGTARVKEAKIFLTALGPDQVVVEQVQIESDAEYVAWIRAFPSRPEIQKVESNFFPQLAEKTVAHGPAYREVQERIFSPSLVLGLYRQIFVKKPQIEQNTPTAGLEVNPGNFSIIKGEVVSSTITQTRSFPADFEAWIDANNLVISAGNQRKLMQYCELGWYLAFGLIDTRFLQEDVNGIVPALEYRFEHPQAVHPSLLIANEDVNLEYWTLGDAPMVPSGRVLNLNGSSNKTVDIPNQFEVSYQRATSGDQFTGTALEDLVKPEGRQHLLRGRLNSGKSIQRVQMFEAHADMQEVPQSAPRGRFQDLLFSLLLGIAPIFLLPESWLLYWIRHQGKLERTRVNPNPLTTKIWPLYCIGIAVFWGLSQTGTGKIALVLPLLFGIWSLRTQETPEGRVVVTFKKPKKTVRSSQAPKS